MDEKTKRVIITGMFSLACSALTAVASIIGTKSDILDKLNEAIAIIGLEKSENLAELLTNIENISNENNQLTNDLNKFKTTNTKLLNENNLLKKENENLTAKNEKLAKDNVDLDTKINTYVNLPTLKLVDTEIINKGLNTGSQQIAYIDSRLYYPEGLINDIISEDISLEDNILYIGHSNQEKVKLLDVANAFGYNENCYSNPSSFYIADTKYKDGFTITHKSTSVLFNLNNEYSKINFIFGHIDETELYDCTLEIYVDEDLYDTINLKPDSIPVNVEINLNYCNYIKFTFSKGWNSSTYGIANPILTR